jgi:hypothetical protein
VPYGRCVIYTYPSDVQDLAERAREGILPIFKQRPGFLAYGVMVQGDQIVSMSAWNSENDTKGGTAGSTRIGCRRCWSTSPSWPGRPVAAVACARSGVPPRQGMRAPSWRSRCTCTGCAGRRPGRTGCPGVHRRGGGAQRDGARAAAAGLGYLGIALDERECSSCNHRAGSFDSITAGAPLRHKIRSRGFIIIGRMAFEVVPKQVGSSTRALND